MQYATVFDWDPEKVNHHSWSCPAKAHIPCPSKIKNSRRQVWGACSHSQVILFSSFSVPGHFLTSILVSRINKNKKNNYYITIKKTIIHLYLHTSTLVNFPSPCLIPFLVLSFHCELFFYVVLLHEEDRPSMRQKLFERKKTREEIFMSKTTNRARQQKTQSKASQHAFMGIKIRI